jgi:hypothetical protein
VTQASLEQAQEIVIVSGPAGAGRSTAIGALEDLGFEAIDNMPIGLLPRLFSGSRTLVLLGGDCSLPPVGATHF